MPNNPSERLEWNEENFAKVVAEIYREAETNEALRNQLSTDAFEVLRSRIEISEDYKGGVFTREKGKPIMMLLVPTFGTVSEAMPAGTSIAEAQPDYLPICTSYTIW